MALTTIGSQRTPGSPTQITFAPQTAAPAVVNTVAIIGHMGPATGAASGSQGATGAYVPVQIVNVSNVAAASGEAAGYFGAGSELTRMIVAAVAANQLVGTTFPPLTAIPLLPADVGYGGALVALDRLPGIAYEADCYDANNPALMNLLIAETTAMSLPQRVDAGQFGTIAVAANQSVTSAPSLYEYNSPYASMQWCRNTAPTQLVGEIAASVAAQLAANPVPFNPVKNSILPNIIPPTVASDPIAVGGGQESEVALNRGWSPLRVLPTNQVAQLRAVTTRILLSDGITPVTSYFDVPDFNVLFYWRQTIVTRFNQPDFSNTKASLGTATLMLSELIRMANDFESNGMFQGVAQGAKNFIVQRNALDRSRFDVLTPVDVIPILAVIATNIQATTAYDTLTI